MHGVYLTFLKTGKDLSPSPLPSPARGEEVKRMAILVFFMRVILAGKATFGLVFLRKNRALRDSSAFERNFLRNAVLSRRARQPETPS